MLSHFTVVMCVSIVVVGGKFRFLSGRPRDFGFVFFTIVFAFYARTIVIFSTIAAGLGFFFCSWGMFPPSFNKVVGLGHGVDNFCSPVTVVTVL